jgi:hypothetical protein
MLGHYSTLIYPLILLGVVDATITRNRKNTRPFKSLRWLAIPIAAIVVIDACTFARKGTLWCLLYVLLPLHARRAFRTQHMLSATLVIVGVSLFSQLRNTASSFSDLKHLNLTQTVSLIGNETGMTVLTVAGSVAGQEVVTNVMGYVPQHEPFFHGQTYANSLLGCFTPRFITQKFDSNDIMTPAFWYQQWYAPDVVDHGFDFSLLAEAYINFGQGAVVAFAFIGATIGWLSKTIRQSSSPAAVYCATVAIVSICFGVRTDSNAIMKQIVFFSLLLPGIQAISTFMSRRQPVYSDSSASEGYIQSCIASRR